MIAILGSANLPVLWGAVHLQSWTAGTHSSSFEPSLLSHHSDGRSMPSSALRLLLGALSRRSSAYMTWYTSRSPTDFHVLLYVPFFGTTLRHPIDRASFSTVLLSSRLDKVSYMLKVRSASQSTLTLSEAYSKSTV